MPTHDAWLRSSTGQWDAGGGYITAWGATGIEDEKSQLHERFEVGVHSVGGHHSVDTGKYTLGPYFAELVAERVRPAAPVHPVRQSTW
jgi:hypothetical protein